MKLEKVSAIAEIISSIAVLLTLVYLAAQTNQIAKQTELNTKAILSSSRQESLNAELDVISKFETDAAIYTDKKPINELTPVERFRLYAIFTTLVRIRENLYLQYKNGVLDENTWHSYRLLMIKAIKTDSRFVSFWERDTSQGIYDANFVSEINSLLKSDK